MLPDSASPVEEKDIPFPSNKKESGEEEPMTFDQLVQQFKSLRDKKQLGKIEIASVAKKELQKIINNSGLLDTYDIRFLIQEEQVNSKEKYKFRYEITRSTLDNIYNSFQNNITASKQILLVVNSLGGDMESAYFISKCCKKYSKDNKFLACIPRRAKSAATLISLGACEIHMGDISELGPIDPQIGHLPVLALGEAVKYISKIVEEMPGSSEMFAKFLSYQLNLQVLGYMNRVAETAVDYAVRLLNGKELQKSSKEIARDLVNKYKDHGFVIDKDEAKQLLGANFIKIDTKEYHLANKIYLYLEDVKLALYAVDGKFYFTDFIGTTDNLWLNMSVQDDE